MQIEGENYVSDWTYAENMTLSEFKDAGLAVPGMLVEFRNHDGTTTTSLIGHMNDCLGLCDCCCEDRQAQIVRYRRIWSPDLSVSDKA